MTLSSRFVLRRLRVVIACVILGVLAPLPSASAYVDTIAYATSVPETAANERPKHKRVRERIRETPFKAAAPSPRNRHASRGYRARPPGARTIVVQHRVYLRNAALLC
jgi:hypothetical protein